MSSTVSAEISGAAENHYLLTDQSLVLRILGNMVVNALEAANARQTVTLDCRLKGKEVVFSVSNPGTIPDEVRREIFRRTYSTKGRGRGLGTYSMRLLTSFLQGEVSFVCREGNTTFFLRLAQKLS